MPQLILSVDIALAISAAELAISQMLADSLRFHATSAAFRHFLSRFSAAVIRRLRTDIFAALFSPLIRSMPLMLADITRF
jgi:hypothetical protein